MSMAVLAPARLPSTARHKYRAPQADRSRDGTGLGVAGAVLDWRIKGWTNRLEDMDDSAIDLPNETPLLPERYDGG